MNFPSPVYFTLFVDWSTENQLNILFVCMVVDDNTCLTVKKIGLYYITYMYWKVTVYWKLINEFPTKRKVFAQSEFYLLKNCEKPAQQIDSWAAAHLTHHVLLRTLMQSMIWQSVKRMHQGHTKLPVRSPGKLTFRRGQWDASYTKTSSESAWKSRF